MPTPLIVTGAVLLLLVLLLSLRVRVTLLVRESVQAELRFLCFKIRLLPRRKKVKIKNYSKKRLARDAKKAAKKAAKKKKRALRHKAKADNEKKRTLRENIRFARALTASLIRRTRKHLRVHAVRLHVRVATGDAATTAVAYGAVSQSLAYLLRGLDKVTRLKAEPPDVAVIADFVGERSTADIKITFSLRLFGALATALGVGLTYFRKKRGQRLAPRKKNTIHTKGT